MPGQPSMTATALTGVDSRRRTASFPALYALLIAVALLALALIDDAARGGWSGAGTFFWIDLLAIFLPGAWRLCFGSCGPGERMRILLILGLGLYVVKILHSPSQFTFHDELVTWRSVQDLGATNRLFTANPIVKAFPLYPGIDLAALAINRVSGLPLFPSGLVVIAVARMVAIVALYQMFRFATGSARAAGIAALVYIANPNFVFFDGQFSYESFALPLAIMVIAIVARALATAERPQRWALTGIATLLAVAVAPSHHITSYALALGMLVWTLVLFVRRRGDPAIRIAPAAFVACASALADVGWLIAVGRSTSEYLSPVLGGATGSTFSLLFGSGSGKTPFQSTGGPANSTLEQVMGFGSVAILLALLAFGLWRLRLNRPPNALTVILMLAAAVYPVSLILRLTQAGAETSNRASEFVFLGLGATAGVTLSSALIKGRLNGSRGRLLVVAMLGVLLVGGIVIGWAPSSRLPGPSLVEADARSVDPYDLAAAKWARAHLPAHSRIVADRQNAVLMAAYGMQNPQVGEVVGLQVASLITSPTIGPTEQRIVYQDAIRFIVVDNRLSTQRPVVGYYVEGKESKAFAYKAPLPRAAITKFSGYHGLSRIYDNGQVSIYEVLSHSRDASARAIGGSR
jgi:hypothetical protein